MFLFVFTIFRSSFQNLAWALLSSRLSTLKRWRAPPRPLNYMLYRHGLAGCHLITSLICVTFCNTDLKICVGSKLLAAACSLWWIISIWNGTGLWGVMCTSALPVQTEAQISAPHPALALALPPTPHALLAKSSPLVSPVILGCTSILPFC